MSRPSAAEVRDREDRVVQFRLAGMNFDAIAKAVGFRDRSAAWKAYSRAMTRRAVPEGGSREDEIALEVARLDQMQAQIWPRANRGDLAAMDRVLKIMERRDRLAARISAAPVLPAEGVVVGLDVVEKLRRQRAAKAQ